MHHTSLYYYYWLEPRVLQTQMIARICSIIGNIYIKDNALNEGQETMHRSFCLEGAKVFIFCHLLKSVRD